jgi:DNA-binding transcriptional LysR family regulator
MRRGNMDFKNLVSFKIIAETQSFSRAAIVLGYAQSTISFQIKQLETELGVPLFDRIGNQIRLTDSGRILLDYTIKILSLSDEVKHVIAQDSSPSGTLRIAGISSICANLLPELIKKYNELFPDVTISTTTVSKQQVLEKVNNGSADIGLYMDFDKSSKDIFTAVNIENELCFICSTRNTLCNKRMLSIKDLEGFPIIATEPQCCYREIMTNLFLKNDMAPSILFESENTEVIKRFVQSDIGISFLPEIAVGEEIATHKLCKLNITDCIPNVYINVIHKKNQWMTPAIREFFNLFDL